MKNLMKVVIRKYINNKKKKKKELYVQGLLEGYINVRTFFLLKQYKLISNSELYIEMRLPLRFIIEHINDGRT